MSNLQLVNVVKRFGQVTAVNGLSLEVQQGEFVSLLGPSGCGKTTALRLIAGYEQVDDGDILIRGRSTRGVPPYRRNVGMVFQNYALFPHLSVADNIGFGLRERHVDRETIRRKVDESLRLVRLPDLDRRFPSELSGGQQQRVALARALVIEPELLLLDEPLSNLDAQLREEMRIEIKELQAKLGITTVFVTHDQVEALTLSSRVVIMRNGSAAQIGTPEEVYRTPRARFAFEFLGGANVFAGRLIAGAGADPIFETTSGLRFHGRSNGTSAGAVRFAGVRPEDIVLRSTNGVPATRPRVTTAATTTTPGATTPGATLPHATEATNRFDARVRSVLYRGWTREVVLDLASGDTLKAVELLPRVGHVELPADGAVTVAWGADACHFLEAD